MFTHLMRLVVAFAEILFINQYLTFVS